MEVSMKEVLTWEYVIKLTETELVRLKDVLKANLDIPFALRFLEELVKETGP